MDRLITLEDMAAVRDLEESGDRLGAAMLVFDLLGIDKSKVDLRHMAQVADHAVRMYAEEEIDPLDDASLDSLIGSGSPSPKPGSSTSAMSEPSSETPPKRTRKPRNEQLAPVG